MVSKVTVLQKRAIEARVADFVKQYTESQVSKRALAPVIGIYREDIYKVLKGELRLTSPQLILLLYKLMNEGIDLEEWIKQVIGEGDQCILSDGSGSSLQRQSLERQLASRLRRHR